MSYCIDFIQYFILFYFLLKKVNVLIFTITINYPKIEIEELFVIMLKIPPQKLF